MKKLLVIFLLTIYSCSSDEQNEPTDTVNSSVIVTHLVNESITWKIASASLSNNSVSDLDVSQAFNLKDDEFIFRRASNTSQVNLEHKVRNDFNKNAASFSEFLLDFYKSPVQYTMDVSQNDTSLSDSSGSITLNYLNENTITGQLSLDNNAILSVNLEAVPLASVNSTPTTFNFQEIMTFSLDHGLDNRGGHDFKASEVDNSLYLAKTTSAYTNPVGTDNRAEQIVKFDLDNNSYTSNHFFMSALYTKRLEIVNNQLRIIGSHKINTYNMEGTQAIGSSIQFTTGDVAFLSRHGTAIVNNDIYYMGGNLNNPDPADPSSGFLFDGVFKLNPTTNNFSIIANTPSYKSMAACESIDDDIYLIGGQTHYYVCDFSTPGDGETISYIFNTLTNTFTSFDLPVPYNTVYSTKKDNLIYLVGQNNIYGSCNEVVDVNFEISVYNTTDGSHTVIPTNLNDSDNYTMIFGISRIGDTLYIIYGDSSQPFNEPGTYSIMKADI